jgi:hypothetical protein
MRSASAVSTGFEKRRGWAERLKAEDETSKRRSGEIETT